MRNEKVTHPFGNYLHQYFYQNPDKMITIIVKY